MLLRLCFPNPLHGVEILEIPSLSRVTPSSVHPHEEAATQLIFRKLYIRGENLRSFHVGRMFSLRRARGVASFWCSAYKIKCYYHKIIKLPI